ncbi:MAG: hypothetical protein RLZZ328_1511 [Bacteroidota bacterium]|jgi:hypothetical protein
MTFQLIWFERNYPIPGGISARSKELEKNGFTGTMYPYGIFIGDYFTRIAREIDQSSSFNYIVAIRPYVISAQYLHMICSSLNNISRNRISINFLTGWIYDEEKNFGGILSEINDKSSNIERSNYMIDYAKEFKRISRTNFYISTTNETIFLSSSSNEFPMIIPYSWYKRNKSKITNEKYLISVAPIIYDEHKETSYDERVDLFTKDEFFRFLDDCKSKNVEGVLIREQSHNTEYINISKYINEYTATKSEAEK